MVLDRVKDAAAAFSQQALGKTAYVMEVSRSGDGWKAMIEVVEEKGFIDDILGVYEIILDGDMNVISYRRKGLRRRSDVSPKEWQKEE